MLFLSYITTADSANICSSVDIIYDILLKDGPCSPSELVHISCLS